VESPPQRAPAGNRHIELFPTFEQRFFRSFDCFSEPLFHLDPGFVEESAKFRAVLVGDLPQLLKELGQLALSSQVADPNLVQSLQIALCRCCLAAHCGQESAHRFFHGQAAS